MSNYSDSAFSEDENSSWFKAYNYIASGSTVLDIGCSNGTFGAVLKEKKGCTVDGIELDEQDFKAAKKNLRNVYQLNVETDDLSVVDKTYDFIYFGDVIEHLVWPAASLARVRSLLKPTGKLVFSIPNMSHLSVRLMLLKGDFIYGETGLLDKTHLHFYTHAEIQRVFAGGGYVVTDLSPVLKDLPKEIIEKELQQVGLKLTPEFLQFAATTEASVYQFVGTAEAQKSPAQKSKQLDISSPVDKFQTYLNETKQYYETNAKADKLHIAKQEKLLTKLGSDLATTNDALQQTRNELDHLLKNPVVKVARKARHLNKRKER